MPGAIEEYRESRQRLEALAERYRGDAGLRSRIESGDVKEALECLDIELPAAAEARIAADTDEITHLVFPPDPNAELSDAELNIVSGGGASSLGTVGSIGCFPSCLGSAGTISSWRDDNSPV